MSITKQNLPESMLESDNCGSLRYLALVCLVTSLGGFLFGFDTAVISGTAGMVEQ